jgi:hypothetical protein
MEIRPAGAELFFAGRQAKCHFHNSANAPKNAILSVAVFKYL